MSDTPRTDAADLYDYQTAVDTCRQLERDLAAENRRIVEREKEIARLRELIREATQDLSEELVKAQYPTSLAARMFAALKGEGR